MRCPSRSKLKSFSTGTDGYGVPPSVNTSHKSTPYDQLQQQNNHTPSSSDAIGVTCTRNHLLFPLKRL